MKVTLILMLCVMLFSGLLAFTELYPETEQHPETRYGNHVIKTVYCIDNVEYLNITGRYTNYLVPHFKLDGTLYGCD